MIRVHVVARDNGAGLSRDLEILERALVEAGFEVVVSAIGQGGLRRLAQRVRVQAGLLRRGWRGGAAARRFDVNLMDERVRPEYFGLARRNVLLPHPEWFRAEWTGALGSVDRVFVKTRHAVPLFEALGCAVDFVGFTSLDRLRREVPREPVFFHLAGRSGNKGTQPLLEAWSRHPEWPTLTVVQRAKLKLPEPRPANLQVVTEYLDDAALRELQNRHVFHVCPSETEGFGHHLVEAMSVGAVVLATDAPPMNEMVTPQRGVLAPYARTGTQRLATTYFVDAAGVEAAVERMLALTPDARASLGAEARAWYERNDREFRRRLADAVAALAA
ncbi:MAG TPA: glycosyltransferase [Dokdonella sp.]